MSVVDLRLRVRVIMDCARVAGCFERSFARSAQTTNTAFFVDSRRCFLPKQEGFSRIRFFSNDEWRLQMANNHAEKAEGKIFMPWRLLLESLETKIWDPALNIEDMDSYYLEYAFFLEWAYWINTKVMITLYFVVCCCLELPPCLFTSV